MPLFRAATKSTVGNDDDTLFWEDRWIQGLRVGRGEREARTASQGLANGAWAADVGPELTANMLQEYLRLCDQLEGVQLNQDEVDSTVWAWEPNGHFSTRSAYTARFWGREVVPTAEFTWKSKAPLRCRFFAWTTFQNRVWTSERLARRALDHQEACPL